MQLIQRDSRPLPGYLGGPFPSITVNPDPHMTPDDLVHSLGQLFRGGPVPVHGTIEEGRVLIIMPDPDYVQWRLRQEPGSMQYLADLVLRV